MKDYDRLIIWLDYLDSKLSRKDGRRVPVSRAVSRPLLSELEEAAKRLGYDPKSTTVYHPKRGLQTTGMISIEKKGKKSDIVNRLNELMIEMRAGKKA